MDKLLAYLNSLQGEEREAFARRCGTSVGYLRKAGSVKQQLSEGLCLRIYAESAGKVGLEDLRPGVDWQYLRDALANTVHTSTYTAEAIAAARGAMHSPTPCTPPLKP